MRSIALLVLTLFLGSTAYAQLFNRTYGAAGGELPADVVRTADGGFAVCGYTTSYGAGDNDAFLFRTDSMGTWSWGSWIGSTTDDRGQAIAEAPDGGFLVASEVLTGQADSDLLLARFSAGGNLLWQRMYGGPDREWVADLLALPDSTWVLAGASFSYTTSPNLSDGLLMKLSATGDVLWQTNMQPGVGGGTARIAAVEQDLQAGLWAAGTMGNRAWLMRMNNGGDTLWTRLFADALITECTSVAATADGGAVLAGRHSAFGAPTEGLLLKVDSLGTLQWQRAFSVVNGTAVVSSGNEAVVLPTSDGGQTLALCSQVTGSGPAPMLIHTDANGDTLWTRSYMGVLGGLVNGAGRCPNDGAITVSHTSTLALGWEAHLIRTDALGNSNNPCAEDHRAVDVLQPALAPVTLELTVQDSVFPEWPSAFPWGAAPMAEASACISTVIGELPPDHTGITIDLDPSTATWVIGVNSNTPGLVEVAVYDVMGRTVAVWSTTHGARGEVMRYSCEGCMRSGGAYICRVNAGGRTASKVQVVPWGGR